MSTIGCRLPITVKSQGGTWSGREVLHSEDGCRQDEATPRLCAVFWTLPYPFLLHTILRIGFVKLLTLLPSPWHNDRCDAPIDQATRRRGS
jgi:hypothetical protein